MNLENLAKTGKLKRLGTASANWLLILSGPLYRHWFIDRDEIRFADTTANWKKYGSGIPWVRFLQTEIVAEKEFEVGE